MEVFRILFYYLVVLNGYVFISYFRDKRLAIRKKRRISERTLLLGALLGGGMGGFLGMFVNHHKTRKWYFYLGNLLAIIIWMGIIYALIKYN